MRDTDLFQLALGLAVPWTVESCDFDPEHKRLDIQIGFERGGKFPCPACGRSGCGVHDTVNKKWRHLNFFEHETYLHVRTPRVTCPDCGVRLVPVPWARPGSGFTLLFEAFLLAMIKEMPVNAVARVVGEYDTRIWRVLRHYVGEARSRRDDSKVTGIGVDETSMKRGHNYVTLFVDLARSRVLFATPGKDAETLTSFRKDFKAHGGNADRIRRVCCDMSPAYIRGVEDEFKKASITFDKFHVMKVVNDAVDEVRRMEQRDRPELRKSRYVWLKNPENLKESQRETLKRLDVKKLNLKTSRAYHLKLTFQELYAQPKESAEAFLKRWYFWATHSRLKPMVEAARTIKRHWDGVLQWFDSRINNGILEGINSLIQAAKAKARGYKSVENLVTIIYLIAGKLEMNVTHSL